MVRISFQRYKKNHMYSVRCDALHLHLHLHPSENKLVRTRCEVRLTQTSWKNHIAFCTAILQLAPLLCLFLIFLPRLTILCCQSDVCLFLFPPTIFSCSLLCPYIHAVLAPFYDGIRSTSVSTFEASCCNSVLLQFVMVLSTLAGLRGW